jgi:hypothetical protein
MKMPTVPRPADLIDRRAAAAPSAPPAMPTTWTAQVLLTPFGDANPKMSNYSQLIAANVLCDNSGATPDMIVQLFLTENLTVSTFYFVDGAWYWVDPGRGRVYGPFATSLMVPPADFLAQGNAVYGNHYEVMGAQCDHWIVPTDPTHGSWYAIREDTGNLFRIFTFDNNNPVRIPILGSYYLANIASFTPSASGAASAELAMARRLIAAGTVTAPPAAMSNPLLTQQDIEAALANPLASATCTLAEIQAVIPGFTPNPPNIPIPVWTDQTFIMGMTIGTDFIPYFTLVFYDYGLGKQQTIFLGLGLTAGEGTYNDRQDCCLTTSQTDVPQYYWDASSLEWVANCCDGTISGVGLPYPDWLTRDGGKVVAQIAGNAAFGLQPNEVLNLFNAPLDRGPGELALFWVWFLGDNTGVLFTEANFKNPTDHNLQLIDYTLFQQNATISPSVFSDPCPSLQACPTQPGMAARPKGERRLIGPRTVVRPPVQAPTGIPVPDAVPTTRG